jgi:hypothetical protein
MGGIIVVQHFDTIVLQNELRRSQMALDKCRDEKSIKMYRDYIRDLASELLHRYREAKLTKPA